MLATGGVLKFIDENVPYAITELQPQLGRVAVLSNRIQCALRVLAEIDGALLGEDNLQIGGRQRKQLQNRAHELPLRVRVMRVRQAAHAAQSFAEFGRRGLRR